MLGIGKEFAVFLHAGLTGVLVVSVYLSLRVLRRLIKHTIWVINIEDAIFWITSSIYLFVQIYYTSSGVIRWYFVLGVVFGVLFMRILTAFAKKVHKKISVFTSRK